MSLPNSEAAFENVIRQLTQILQQLSISWSRRRQCQEDLANSMYSTAPSPSPRMILPQMNNMSRNDQGPTLNQTYPIPGNQSNLQQTYIIPQNQSTNPNQTFTIAPNQGDTPDATYNCSNLNPSSTPNPNASFDSTGIRPPSTEYSYNSSSYGLESTGNTGSNGSGTSSRNNPTTGGYPSSGNGSETYDTRRLLLVPQTQSSGCAQTSSSIPTTYNDSRSPIPSSGQSRISPTTSGLASASSPGGITSSLPCTSKGSSPSRVDNSNIQRNLDYRSTSSSSRAPLSSSAQSGIPSTTGQSDLVSAGRMSTSCPEPVGAFGLGGALTLNEPQTHALPLAAYQDTSLPLDVNSGQANAIFQPLISLQRQMQWSTESNNGPISGCTGNSSPERISAYGCGGPSGSCPDSNSIKSQSNNIPNTASGSRNLGNSSYYPNSSSEGTPGQSASLSSTYPTASSPRSDGTSMWLLPESPIKSSSSDHPNSSFGATTGLSESLPSSNATSSNNSCWRNECWLTCPHCHTAVKVRVCGDNVNFCLDGPRSAVREQGTVAQSPAQSVQPVPNVQQCLDEVLNSKSRLNNPVVNVCQVSYHAREIIPRPQKECTENKKGMTTKPKPDVSSIPKLITTGKCKTIVKVPAVHNEIMNFRQEDNLTEMDSNSNPNASFWKVFNLIRAQS